MTSTAASTSDRLAAAIRTAGDLVAYRRVTAGARDERYAVAFRALGMTLVTVTDAGDETGPVLVNPEPVALVGGEGRVSYQAAIGAALEQMQARELRADAIAAETGADLSVARDRARFEAAHNLEGLR